MALEQASHEVKRHHHRRLVVDRQFQFKYAMILASLGFLLCLVTGSGLLLMVRQNYDLLVAEGLLQTPAVIEHLSTERAELFWRFFTLSVFVVIAFFLAGLYITNRFVGPMKGFERELRKLKSGNLCAYLSLRNSDEFQSIAELFNDSMQMLREETQKDLVNVGYWKENIQKSSQSEAVKKTATEMDRWVVDKKNKTQFLS